jgi:drug/metabolite transporter (DMT)-like permease
MPSAQRPAITQMHGTLAGLVPCAVWSCAVLAMNQLAAKFNALWAAGLELGIAGAILVGVAWIRGDLPRIALHSTRCHIACGTFWLLHLTLSWLAIAAVHNIGELLVAGLLNYLWPSLTFVLAIPILHKRATWWLAPGLLCVLLGLTLGKIATAPEGIAREAFTHVNGVAYSLAISDAVAWALYSNLSRKLSNPNGASAVPLYMLVTSTILLTASTLTETPISPPLADWALLGAWSVATALAYLLWDVGMRFGSVVTISAISMLIPLLSTIITAVVLGHGISTSLVIAATLVVAGSMFCGRGAR